MFALTSPSRTHEAPAVVRGEVIPYKKEPAFLLAVAGAGVIALGGACWAIHFAIKEWLEWKLFTFGGIVLPVIGLILLFFALRNLVRPESRALVIGTDRLQIVVNGEKVVEQYHYGDVRGYKLTGNAVGIELEEAVSDQTVLPAEDLRAYLRENYGHEAIIEPRILCPPDKLLEKIEARRQAYLGGA